MQAYRCSFSQLRTNQLRIMFVDPNAPPDRKCIRSINTWLTRFTGATCSGVEYIQCTEYSRFHSNS